ncbi:MAG TPA: SGNH/GDSL hydrolase family protein [Polyangiaceae bacterium]|nr:SGNH/GDSL hydrolase family protein [Polyangiaceae bacterium]
MAVAGVVTMLGCSPTIAPAGPTDVSATGSERAVPARAGPPTTATRRENPQPEVAPTAAPSADAPAATTPVAETPVPAGPPLPAGTTILQIGDSFAGALGIDLNRELKGQGVHGVLKYETSTYIPTWAGKKDLDEYLSRFHPDLVLITLGANELLIPDPAQRAPTIHRLVGRLGGRACVWVAPPLWHGARPALLQTIRESCAPCVYLDSSALVPDLERMRDHIHPSMQGRKIWAKAVLEWLREHRDPNGQRPWDMKAPSE